MKVCIHNYLMGQLYRQIGVGSVYFYNEDNRKVFNTLSLEEQEEIKEVLNYNFRDSEVYPHANDFCIKEIELHKWNRFETVEIYLDILYDGFSVPYTYKREVNEIEFENLFEQYLETELGYSFDEDENTAILEVINLLYKEPEVQESLKSLVEEDLIDYLNREEEVLYGEYGREIYKIFETLTPESYYSAYEDYVFNNLDRYL